MTEHGFAKISYTRKVKPGRKSSEAQALCEEIWEWLDRRLPFPRLRRMINEVGVKSARETFEQLKKQNGIRDRLPYFIKVMANQRPTFK